MIREIETEEEAIAALKVQNLDGALPEFLFHDSRYQRVVLSLLENGKQTGLFFGIMAPGETIFYLHHFSIHNVRCSLKTFSATLSLFFSYLKEHYTVSQVVAHLSWEKAEKPLFVSALDNISFCNVESIIYIRQICIQTKDFPYLRQFRWYCPELLEKKQYKAVLCKGYSQESIQRIKEEELWHRAEEDYLSPGLWERDWEYDEKTSFFLVKQGKSEPLGWIVTEKTGDGRTVKIRRFYIQRELRKKIIGPLFATWVLDVIAENYEYMAYEVVRGNEQMERFTDRYCKPLKVYDYFQCIVKATV